MAAKNLVLRTVYIDPDVDDALRNEAFEGRTSKNDLIRKYIKLGMQRSLAQGERDLKGADKKVAVTSGSAPTKRSAPKTMTAKKAAAGVSSRGAAAKKSASKGTTKSSKSGAHALAA